MFKHRLFALVVTTVVVFLPDALKAQNSELFSPSIADVFREKAVALYTDPNAAASEAVAAMAFLDAADNLDKNVGSTLPDMVRLAWRFPTISIYDRIKPVFMKYAVNDTADLEVLRLGTQYLLEPLNMREQREEFFGRVLWQIGTRHKIFGSDIMTQLGLFAAERGDIAQAEGYLMQAYNDNPYNAVAFQKLMEITPQTMPLALYLRHLRLMMGANPYDIDAAYAFANGAYNVGLYSVAASAYEYCADLFAVLHPNEPLPPTIAIPWAISNYNDPQGLRQCLNIAATAAKTGRFDLCLEAIAGNAAVRLGNGDEGPKRLRAAAQKGEQLFAKNQIAANDLAWFYCFAKPDAEKALEWANKANAADPNSPRTAAILAYALVLNGQYEIAKPLVEQNYQGRQIAALAMGQIQLALDPNADPNTTVGIIKSAVALDAGSLEAQRGKELLAQKGSTYVPVYETAVITKTLRSEFGDAIVNKFVTADKLIAVKIAASGNEFPYGSRFNATLAITNKGNDPLMIFDGGLLGGTIKVDAVVRGDLNERLPNLIVQKIRPPNAVEAGRSLFVPLKLTQGRLASLLLEHPQAKVEIEFTVWLDPVTDPNGRVHNALAAIEPARLTVRRNAADVSGSYLQTRLGSLTQGQPGQKIKTAQLFAGLLLEQRATAGKKPYRMMYVEPQLLRAGLAKCLTDESWTLKVETMLLLADVPLDYNLTNAVSDNLNSNFWPVRMTALWLLGKDQNPAFKKVRDWTAENDSDKMVVEMAVALGSPAPKRAEEAAAAEPNLPARALASPATKTVPPAAATIQKTVAPEPNQPAARVAAEPNQSEKAAATEPNRPQAKPAEPNDVIEDILKS